MKESMKTTIMFLIIDYDDHGETGYIIKDDLEEALACARELADNAKISYGTMASYKTEFDERDKYKFCECGEERWHVKVEEIEVPLRNPNELG